MSSDGGQRCKCGGVSSRLIAQSACGGQRAAVPYTVVPLSGGGVQIERRSDAGAIEVEVGPEGAFDYLLIKGTGASREFEERDNIPQLQVVELENALSPEGAKESSPGRQPWEKAGKL